MKFIEHNDPQADYVINDASMLELLCDLEFTDSSDIGNFMRYDLRSISKSGDLRSISKFDDLK